MNTYQETCQNSPAVLRGRKGTDIIDELSNWGSKSAKTGSTEKLIFQQFSEISEGRAALKTVM